MIVPVEVDRDAWGYWTHPALIRSCWTVTSEESVQNSVSR